MNRNLWGRFAKVTVLPDSNRGRNRRGLCSHKASRYTKKPKSFHVSDKPRELSASRTDFGRTIA